MALSDGPERKQLPEALAGALAELEEGVGLRAQIADAMRARQRGRVEQQACGPPAFALPRAPLQGRAASKSPGSSRTNALRASTREQPASVAACARRASTWLTNPITVSVWSA